MVHGHRHVEVQVCVSTPKITSTLVSGLSGYRESSSRACSSFRCGGHFSPDEQEESRDDTVRGGVSGELL
jgi:hypothetical protein